jgi:hypothetical protein
MEQLSKPQRNEVLLTIKLTQIVLMAAFNFQELKLAKEMPDGKPNSLLTSLLEQTLE